jgi:Fibrinogen beta and gamma chains, C-terminal globular domain
MLVQSDVFGFLLGLGLSLSMWTNWWPPRDRLSRKPIDTNVSSTVSHRVIIVFDCELVSTIPRDCADVQNLVGPKSGVYTVYIGSYYRPVTVYCDMNTTFGGWTVSNKKT